LLDMKCLAEAKREVKYPLCAAARFMPSGAS